MIGSIFCTYIEVSSLYMEVYSSKTRRLAMTLRFAAGSDVCVTLGTSLCLHS
jgi:hypothetical protein